MRYTLVCIGSTGDVRPYLLLGKELVRRGHDVGVCTFDDFQEMIVANGMRFLPLTGDAKEFIGNMMKPGISGIGYLQQVKQSLHSILGPFLSDLEAACADCDAIVSTYLGMVIYSIAEKRKVPFVQSHFFPMDPNSSVPISGAPGQRVGRGWNLMTYRLAYLMISAMEMMYLTEWRKALGVKPRKMLDKPAYRINGHTIPVVYAISPLLLPRPKDWRENVHMTGFWTDEEITSFTPSRDLERFLQEGDTPVYIGFGSMTSGDMGETLSIVLEAVQKSGVRAIISKGWGGVEIPEQKGVFVVDYVPHDWLFHHVSAVVHHGGAGTTATGVLAGKPTLVIPFGGDQPFWAVRVRMLGIGPKPIRREKLTSIKLAKALRELVTVQSYRIAVQEVGECMRSENGTFKAANIIEREVDKWLQHDAAHKYAAK